MVDYVTDIFILKPLDPTRSNHRLFFDVNNRGDMRALSSMDNATTGANDPTTAGDGGNGLLLEQVCRRTFRPPQRALSAASGSPFPWGASPSLTRFQAVMMRAATSVATRVNRVGSKLAGSGMLSARVR
jgi:hypothetical protein